MQKMDSLKTRQNFLEFWKQIPRNSKEIPNSSLIPQNDPTLLFVNSGMFPLVPYLNGQPHPLGKRLHNIQRCIRTNDIEEVGDNRHLVFFEMIGNWSLGDFSKEQQIPWIMEFFVENCGLSPYRIYVSIFEGDESSPRDDLAIEIWQETFKKYNINAKYSNDITNIPPQWDTNKEIPDEVMNWPYRIFPYNKKKNWWCRAEVPGEIGGPTSEIFYDMGKIEKTDENYHINDESGRFIEIGNNVFMEFKLNERRKWIPLEQKNIDFGGGFERIVMSIQNTTDPYQTDLFSLIINKITMLSKTNYFDLEPELKKSFRIVAEHIRSSVLLLADGVIPDNKDQGYILRRLIRRMVRHANLINIRQTFAMHLAEEVIENYKQYYKHLENNKDLILTEIDKEEFKFNKTLKNGIRRIYEIKKSHSTITGFEAFKIYETFGFPVEMIAEELKDKITEKEKFLMEFKQAELSHKISSKAGSEKKFKGGLADHSTETIKLHTAQHILLAAIQKVIDTSIKQRGSNITSERIRLDFNYHRKLTPEEITRIEDLANEQINKCLDVKRVEMPKKIAEKLGAQMEFGQKYPDIVSVYFIGNFKDITDKDYFLHPDKERIFSVEFCGGPHVQNTCELYQSKNGRKRLKIISQESIGENIKRIKAVLAQE